MFQSHLLLTNFSWWMHRIYLVCLHIEITHRILHGTQHYTLPDVAIYLTFQISPWWDPLSLNSLDPWIEIFHYRTVSSKWFWYIHRRYSKFWNKFCWLTELPENLSPTLFSAYDRKNRMVFVFVSRKSRCNYPRGIPSATFGERGSNIPHATVRGTLQ